MNAGDWNAIKRPSKLRPKMTVPKKSHRCKIHREKQPRRNSHLQKKPRRARHPSQLAILRRPQSRPKLTNWTTQSRLIEPIGMLSDCEPRRLMKRLLPKWQWRNTEIELDGAAFFVAESFFQASGSAVSPMETWYKIRPRGAVARKRPCRGRFFSGPNGLEIALTPRGHPVPPIPQYSPCR